MSVRQAGRFLCTTKPPQSVNDPKGGLGGAHASKGQREILETRQQGFSISWISLTLLIVLVYQAHHFFIGKCF